jgi:hypothetical protein
VRLSRAEFVALLGSLAAVVGSGDSFEGTLQYLEVEGDQYEVGCSYRVGNLAGQGGVVLVEFTGKAPSCGG